MEINKKFIGHIVKCKIHGDILVCEENLDKLISINSNVLVKAKSKAKKFKGIKEDDNNSTESAE